MFPLCGTKEYKYFRTCIHNEAWCNREHYLHWTRRVCADMIGLCKQMCNADRYKTVDVPQGTVNTGSDVLRPIITPAPKSRKFARKIHIHTVLLKLAFHQEVLCFRALSDVNSSVARFPTLGRRSNTTQSLSKVSFTATSHPYIECAHN